MRVLINNGFYGLLLMHMNFAIDEDCETAATDGRKIIFGPDFLENLSDSEIDFVMMHEVLHVALRHCARTGDRDNLLFNIACDIVVNSNILYSNNMNIDSITLKDYGPSMHIAPDGKEGYLYTAEEVYEMFKKNACANANGFADDHSKWGAFEEADKRADEVWLQRIRNACESIEVKEASRSRGTIPLCADRILKKLRDAQTDWRTILNDFVQEEVVDYSFTPPDRRYDDSPFFLPDFNETDVVLKDVLFMIDTSGSMSDEMITAAYSEVLGAIRQFGGTLRGWLGFFDAAVTEPREFTDESEFAIIKPKGGGGTNFQAVFDYVNANMYDKEIASIIFLTDGYCYFPDEESAKGVPVLWLLNNEEVKPPWGKVARIKV